MDKYLLEISSVPSVERERTGGVDRARHDLLLPPPVVVRGYM